MSDARYNEDRMFGDRFTFEATGYLGQVLIVPANEFEDMKHNTDLTVETNDRGTVEIAMRIRRPNYKNDYSSQFTLCCHRNSGCDAEFQKITGCGKEVSAPWGDYMFFGFADENKEHLDKWFIGRFDQFRKIVPDLRFKSYGWDDPHIGAILLNGEQIGECRKVPRRDKWTGEVYFDYFYAFEKDAIPGFVIADSDHWPPKIE